MDSNLQLLRHIWTYRNRNKEASVSLSNMSSTVKSSQYHNPHTLVWKLPDSPALDINIFDSGYASAESAKDSASSREEATPLRQHILGGKRVANYDSNTILSTRKTPPRLAEIPFFAPLCPSITSVRTPGGGMKLPPTIVTRQMPLPIQNLPTLSPSPQTATDHTTTERLRRPSLHSVPSLTRIGREAPAEMDDGMEEINEEDEEMDADEFEDAAEPGSPTSSHSNSNASVLTQSNPDFNNGITSVAEKQTPRLADTQVGKEQGQSTPRSSRASPSHHIDNDDYFALTYPETSFLLPIIVTTAASASASHHHPSGTSAAPQARGFNGSNVDHHNHPPTTLSIQAQDLSNANVHTFSPPPASPTAVERRPSIYRQASQSMANLLSPTQLHAAAASAIALTSGYGDQPSKQRLSRRTSMPSMQPPTYVAATKHSDAQFARFRHLRSEPREEEGLEPLPSYELTVPLLSGLLLMKMEFSSPGILSKERNWHRVWCVLQGTSFKVYEGEKGLEKIGGWIGRQKERVAMMEAQNARNKGKGRDEDPIRIRTVAPGETEGDDRPKFTVSPATSSSTRLGGSSSSSSRNPRPHARTRSRESMSSTHSQYASSSHTSINESGQGSMSSSSSNLEVPPPSRSHRRSFTQAIQMIKTNGSNMVMRASATASTSSLSMTMPVDPMESDMRRSSSPISPTTSETSVSDMSASFAEISNITSRQLVRHYTLQNAESGVAIDYHKKPNVIRVRLEGEQFLLQVKGVKEVVEWIEGFQSAADIALDLDDRPMPRGPMFPRRRRRRPRTHDPYAEPASAATSEAEP